MPAQFRTATSYAQQGYTQTISVTIPSDVQAGDLLLAQISGAGSSATFNQPGWTHLAESGTSDNAVYWKWATATDPGATLTYTYNPQYGYDSRMSMQLLAYSQVVSVGGTPFAAIREQTYPQAGQNNGYVSESATEIAPFGVPHAGLRVVEFVEVSSSISGQTGIDFAGWPQTYRTREGRQTYVSHIACDYVEPDGGQTTAGRVYSSYNYDSGVSWRYFVVALYGNTAPNAPTLLGPADGSVVNATNSQRFSWRYSDPDAADSQSQAELRYRQVGTSTWTTVTIPNPNGYWDAEPGTFANADYEWQVRTYDQHDAPGAWSSSWFFTAATPPPGPTITAPTSGATVTQDEVLVQWSASDQGAYQVRMLDAQTSAVLYDSGVVESASIRQHQVALPTNNVDRVLEVRVRRTGLWSGYSQVTITVSYAAPVPPVVTLTPDHGQGVLRVSIENPTPGTGQPAVTHNSVSVEDPGQPLERRAEFVPTDGTWVYWRPVGDVDYAGRIHVTAYGDNTTSTTVVA